MDRCTPNVNHPPDLGRYMVSSEVERDWVMATALGYLLGLELERLPSERLTARHSRGQDFALLRPFVNFAARKLLDRGRQHLSKSEDGAIQLQAANSAGICSEADLLCLAVLQHAYSLQLLAHRLSKQGGSSDRLWEIYSDLMYFCHSEAFALHGVYEERTGRRRINRKTARDPNESYKEWRNRASPAFVELRPKSLQFVRSDASPVVWREDRSEFHKRWVDEQIAQAWKHGYKPY